MGILSGLFKAILPDYYFAEEPTDFSKSGGRRCIDCTYFDVEQYNNHNFERVCTYEHVGKVKWYKSEFFKKGCYCREIDKDRYTIR